MRTYHCCRRRHRCGWLLCLIVLFVRLGLCAMIVACEGFRLSLGVLVEGVSKVEV